jgi:uncharacterized membrane protein
VKRDLAAAVRAVFSAKCARCHGPHLAKPKGRFGHVLDLRRLAADDGKVVPFKPDESELWRMVRDDEMPPPASPTGALSAAQKETLRAWIAAGAPSEETSSPPPTIPTGAGETAEPPSASPLWRGLLWVGKFHILLVHFPIALLVAAAIGELAAVYRREREPLPAVRFCLALAALFAIPVAALGWLYALGGHGAGSPDLLNGHRWLGTTAAVWAVLIAAFSELDTRRGVRTWRVRVLLLVGVLLVGVAAHLGGLMVHGSDFLDW